MKMKLRSDVVISAAIHAALLAWFAISFSVAPRSAVSDSLPVDIISDKQFSEITAGTRNAPKPETPKPLVDKVEEPKKVDTPEPVAKVVEKPEIKPIPKEAEQKPPEPQQEAKPEPKPEPKKAEKPKPDPIAEAMKKEEARRAAEAKKAKAAAKKQQEFNPDQIAALLDKRNPQRQSLTGGELNRDPTLGLSTGTASQLSMSEIEALRNRLMQLWNPPAGVANPRELMVTVRIKLGRDRKLAGPPVILSSGSSSAFQAARTSAVRALFEGQPYDMLKPENYELWKEIEITFDPRDMGRG